MLPRAHLLPVSASTSFIASQSAVSGTQCGGYLKRATSNKRTRSLAAPERKRGKGKPGKRQIRTKKRAMHGGGAIRRQEGKEKGGGASRLRDRGGKEEGPKSHPPIQPLHQANRIGSDRIGSDHLGGNPRRARSGPRRSGRGPAWSRRPRARGPSPWRSPGRRPWEAEEKQRGGAGGRAERAASRVVFVRQQTRNITNRPHGEETARARERGREGVHNKTRRERGSVWRGGSPEALEVALVGVHLLHGEAVAPAEAGQLREVDAGGLRPGAKRGEGKNDWRGESEARAGIFPPTKKSEGGAGKRRRKAGKGRRKRVGVPPRSPAARSSRASSRRT